MFQKILNEFKEKNPLFLYFKKYDNDNFCSCNEIFKPVYPTYYFLYFKNDEYIFEYGTTYKIFEGIRFYCEDYLAIDTQIFNDIEEAIKVLVHTIFEYGDNQLIYYDNSYEWLKLVKTNPDIEIFECKLLNNTNECEETIINDDDYIFWTLNEYMHKEYVKDIKVEVKVFSDIYENPDSIYKDYYDKLYDYEHYSNYGPCIFKYENLNTSLLKKTIMEEIICLNFSDIVWNKDKNYGLINIKYTKKIKELSKPSKWYGEFKHFNEFKQPFEAILI